MSFRSLSPFEVIGSIVILKRKEDEKDSDLEDRAKELLNLAKVKTAVVQSSKVNGTERTRTFNYLTGVKSLKTTHTEYKLSFSLDLEEVFYSTKLAYERYRISKLVQKNDHILNLFCGVGGFSIFAAKADKSIVVDSIDINPMAIKWAKINAKQNKVSSQCSFYQGDALEEASSLFEEEKYDRILLPLPLLANKSLSTAIPLMKREGWIHYQCSIRLPPNGDYLAVSKRYFEEGWEKNYFHLNISYEIVNVRIIRSLGPRINHVALDIKVTKN